MASLSKRNQKSSQPLDAKIQKLKDKQHALETNMVQLLHRALKAHQGFSLPFPILMGGLIYIMEQAKTDSHQAEVWKVSGGKFLRQRIKQQPILSPSKNNSAVSELPTTMEKSHDQA
jgi:hypothetical protein